MTVKLGKNGMICTVDIDGITHELRDDACIAVDKLLQEAHMKLPVTTIVHWQGAIPLKPSN